MSAAMDLSFDLIKSWLDNSASEKNLKRLQKFFKDLGNLTRDQKSRKISEWYNSERLVLVLGAGASASYGLPDWNTLLQKLLLITIEDEESENENASILAETFSHVFDTNSLISARYLHGYFKKNNPTSKLAFENAIRDALYNGIQIESESDLLKEIRKYCIAAGRSPNLDCIITYNYDDLLERCLSNLEVDIPFSPIHASGMKSKDNQLSIYHVHGYLPSSGQLTTKNRVVLSEGDYHNQYSDMYGWSNLVQINKFKDNNCLFIGLSFSDPNLRRLLDISKKERGDDGIHHYCIKRRHDINQTKSRLSSLLEHKAGSVDSGNLDAGNVGQDLIKFMEKFEENDAASFGVGILWVDDFDEIPEVLANIRTMVK